MQRNDVIAILFVIGSCSHAPLALSQGEIPADAATAAASEQIPAAESAESLTSAPASAAEATAATTSDNVPVIALPESSPAAVSPADEAKPLSGLEEVIVTAQRRDQDAQDVAVSVTVLDEQQLANANIANASELAKYAPSLSANTRFGSENATFAIRGFSQELRTTASVATYFAEVVSPRGQTIQASGDGAAPGELFDLQNVQVLKGPQGTLFGRNSTGGAVLLVPHRPTDSLEGYAEASYGTYEDKRIQAVVNLPVTDWFKLRLGVDDHQRGGYLRNFTGIGADELADVNYTAARLSAVANITDTLENYTIVSYADSDTNGYTSAVFACADSPTDSIFGVFTNAPCKDQLARQQAAGRDGFYDVASTVDPAKTTIKQTRVINTTSWQAADDITVKLIGAYADLRGDNGSDIFGTQFINPVNSSREYVLGTSIISPDGHSTDQETWVAELQTQGTSFGGDLQWQTGLYYEHSLPGDTSYNRGASLLYCDLASLAGDPSNFKCTDPLVGLLGGGVLDARLKTQYLNQAVYGQATYDISTQFSATLGLRYTWDDTKGQVDRTRYVFLPLITTSRETHSESSPEAKSEAPTGVFELAYRPAKDVMTYAKYVRGYRQGSVNLAADPGVDTFEPEKVNSYEIGAKTTFRTAIPFRFNVALFYNELSDMQLSVGYISPALGATTAIFNAGKARIGGAEVEAFAELLPGLTLGLSYSFLDTKLLEQQDHRSDILAAVGPEAALTYSPIAKEGDSLPFAADNTVVTSLSYRLPFPGEIGVVEMGATYVYTGKRRTAASGEPYDMLAPFNLLNLNVNWLSIFNSPVDLSLVGTNVLDEEYSTFYASAWHNSGFESRMVGQPRMIVGRLRYNF